MLCERGVRLFGLVEWRGAGESCAARKKRFSGVCFLAVGLRQGDGLRAVWSLRRAARTLERHGIRQAVLPADFAAYEIFAVRGIEPVDVRPLRAAAAAAIVRRAMLQENIAPQRATVALCGARVTRAYAAAAESLARSTRYLQLCTAHGGWELAQRLCSSLGAAAPVLRRPEGAEVVLCFDDAVDLSGANGIVLPLYASALRVEYDRAVECGAEPEQLLAALHGSLALRAEELKVTRVDWPDRGAHRGTERKIS